MPRRLCRKPIANSVATGSSFTTRTPFATTAAGLPPSINVRRAGDHPKKASWNFSFLQHLADLLVIGSRGEIGAAAVFAGHCNVRAVLRLQKPTMTIWRIARCSASAISRTISLRSPVPVAWLRVVTTAALSDTTDCRCSPATNDNPGLNRISHAAGQADAPADIAADVSMVMSRSSCDSSSAMSADITQRQRSDAVGLHDGPVRLANVSLHYDEVAAECGEQR